MHDTTDLPKFGAWRAACSEPEAMDPFAYIAHEIHPEDFLIAGELYFPRFIEVRGLVVLERTYDAEAFERSYREFFAQPRAPAPFEASWNRVLLYDAFGHSRADEAVYERIGALLRETWGFALQRQFPARRFIVECTHDERDYGPAVCTYQLAP